MAIRKLRLDGDEILKKKSREVEVIDEKIQILIDDMIETMHKYNGVGLAAVQVGVLKRIITIDLYDDNGPIVLINPVIIKTKGEQEVDEGCLSFPNQFAKVIRPAEVVVEYMDRDGKRMKVKAKELLAQAISHEVDHLNGEVFMDKIIPGTLEYVEPEKWCFLGRGQKTSFIFFNKMMFFDPVPKNIKGEQVWILYLWEHQILPKKV